MGEACADPILLARAAAAREPAPLHAYWRQSADTREPELCIRDPETGTLRTIAFSPQRAVAFCHEGIGLAVELLGP